MGRFGIGGRGAAGTATRPALHFTAPDGWLNDPLGVIWRDGRYELFYQALPGARVWNPRCRWGHATSPDLVTWTHHPIALEPDDDEVGCWSGGLVLPDPLSAPSAVILYTSVNEPDLDLGTVRIARPADGTWQHWDQGEVVVTAPTGEDLRVFRDPVVVRDGDDWRMLVGAGYRDGTPAVLTFLSTDLRGWSYDGVLASTHTSPTGPVPAGNAWECPQLVRIGDRHVLIVSTWHEDTTHDVLAGIGTFADGRMKVERWQQLTHGAGHYAATQFTDADGQPCLLFWIREVADPDGAWTGALSVPYRITLEGDVVRLTPHPAVSAAAPGTGVRNLILVDGDDTTVTGTQDDLRLRLDSGVLTITAAMAATVVENVPGPVYVMCDGPVVEVCTGTALIGLPTSTK